ncbi:MAG: Phospho-N-acetylmuramoyl-pentapeptide-transferase [Anaerocolumna sp.]|jgi:phospho-N-acetylmuramoyl-pentapeptide-transferase|nr:Phospho-N-acetylmuramoyl-pentapeptide-transferase [Anaerocolumna sp.]
MHKTSKIIVGKYGKAILEITLHKSFAIISKMKIHNQDKENVKKNFWRMFMINEIVKSLDYKIIAFIGILAAYILTCGLLSACKEMLPRDAGRNFAHNGKVSAGKPRGAGFIFILVFSAVAITVLKLNREIIIYIILTIAAMITGFLDDCSKSPWGEYRKGILDLIIAVMVAITYVNFNSSTIYINMIDKSFTLNPIVFIVLATILVWASINVTNCSDGVDGLCGTLSIITLFSIYLYGIIKEKDNNFNYMILILLACILAYLWFNATPSKMIMGDAGSRALGLFISIAALKTDSPLLYIPLAFILIVDGGLGLIKVSLIRFLKVRIMNNIRTPIHDHVRKNSGWSNEEVVFKFSIIQIIIAFSTLWLLR